VALYDFGMKEHSRGHKGPRLLSRGVLLLSRFFNPTRQSEAQPQHHQATQENPYA